MELGSEGGSKNPLKFTRKGITTIASHVYALGWLVTMSYVLGIKVKNRQKIAQ